MYKRTTEDEYTIQGNYEQGWEDVTYEATLKEAKAQLKTYRDNESGIPHRIIKRRVKIAVC